MYGLFSCGAKWFIRVGSCGEWLFRFACGCEDWYLVSSKQFILSASASSESIERLETFNRKFQLSYRWVWTLTPHVPRYKKECNRQTQVKCNCS
eukprot:5793764-Amphidinium_carterae.1